MQLVDTHCHLTHAPEEELKAIFERAQECSIVRMLSVGASDGIQSARDSLKLAEQYEQVYTSVGVHPHDADEHQTLAEIEELASHPKCVAVGETGLDYFRDWADFTLQKKLFENSISLALNLNKPLIIHCREATDNTLSILRKTGASKVGGVFHCYAEDAEFAKGLVDLNFIVSFTGVVTFKKAEDRRLILKEIPLERIMLETDMPYMAPEPFRGGKSEPMHVYQIAKTIGKVKELSLEEVARITTENAKRVFGLGL